MEPQTCATTGGLNGGVGVIMLRVAVMNLNEYSERFNDQPLLDFDVSSHVCLAPFFWAKRCQNDASLVHMLDNIMQGLRLETYL